MEHELRLRIVLEKPPAGVDFGLQRGRGIDYETVQTERSEGNDLRFEFVVRVRAGRGSAAPNFLGPFVQGPVSERFVYIDIGTYAGQSSTCWSRRLKIPLHEISWEQIEAAVGTALLETKVSGTGRDGGPNCASIKPFPGWKIVPA
jgi:hypothetical protein